MAKFLQRMWALVRMKELVGKDNAGNVFYRHSTTVDGAVTERRWVEYAGEPNPRNLPAEWYSWLIGRRKDAPTSEEIMGLEAYRQRVKMNAAIVEKEEEKRRFRQKSLQHDGNMDTMKPPDMSRFVQQVAALEGVSFDGGDKASMTNSAEQETPTIEETHRGIGENDQGSGKGGHKDPGVQRRKEQVDVYEKWVPPS
ncbi:hypothetical protein GOP47_0005589 [Adiantum capillus-veneris]|uniref:NADH dehydrogenase [ubiquinone] 1 alpha subcomplex subunit 12 n=1 Tax=Adiantum capillus-veneris TaxID=13818 RepID=A0A9D4ZP97_ADICA|nr:hypothetical protein GOP47_0005589 [Adiantum capillus-veneris]